MPCIVSVRKLINRLIHRSWGAKFVNFFLDLSHLIRGPLSLFTPLSYS
jgi:hypothetical protein